jgi:hypothetical protein
VSANTTTTSITTSEVTTSVVAPTLPAETTLPPASTSTAPPATTTPPTTTSTTLPPPPPPCGAFPAIPGGALEIHSATLDAIGDGTADDTATSYFDPGTSQWRIRLDLSTGTTDEVDVPGVGAGVAKVLGPVQVDGGGADEFLALVGSGAATANVGAFGADAGGCLFRFQLDGGPFVAPIGATLTRADGMSCTGAALHLGQAEETGGGLWNVVSQTLGRASATELSVIASSIVGGVSTADAMAAATFDCPGLSL